MSAILDRIKDEEGFRAFVYTCPAGKLSIGFGLNLEDRGITVEEAEYLLKRAVAEAEADVGVLVPNPPGDLTPGRLEALVDMRYNLGPAGLRKFTGMLAAVREGRWGDAAVECLDSLYAAQVPARARRNAELLRNG